MTIDKNNKKLYIPESFIPSYNFPECVCFYLYNDKLMMVEINTGSYLGSIKVISESYNDYNEVLNNFDPKSIIYPILYDHVIYRDY